MSYHPSGRGHEVATKADIARLEARWGEGTEGIGQWMDRFARRMNRFGETLISQQQFFARSMVGALVALTAIFTVVVVFFR